MSPRKHADLLDALRDAEEDYEQEHLILALAATGDAALADDVAGYLDSPSKMTRSAAAFALGYLRSPNVAARLATTLDSDFELTGDSIYGNPANLGLWRVAGFSLGMLQDERSIPPLIQMLREERYWIHGGAGPSTHRGMYLEYSRASQLYMPRRPMDCPGLTGFLMEDLLVRLGEPARQALLKALNRGGLNNDALCYPLRRLGWEPSNPTEEFFFLISDPDKSWSEICDLCDNEDVMPATIERVSRQTLARSLIGRASTHSLQFGAFISKWVAMGRIRLWEELNNSELNDDRTNNALRSFCEDVLWRRRDEVLPTVKGEIEEALRASEDRPG